MMDDNERISWDEYFMRFAELAATRTTCLRRSVGAVIVKNKHILARELTDISLQRIGHAFRKKDHTTVIHAQRKIEQLVKSDPDVKRAVDNIRNKL